MTHKLTPTAEQQKIFDEFAKYDKIKINAYAGAAKTTTLVMLAERNVEKSLYITFNKAMSEEAKMLFPSHVEVRTSHSLAYKHKGRDYQNKLRRPAGGYKNVCGTGGEVARFFRIGPVRGKSSELPAAVLGYAILDTVNRFEHSADTEILPKHVSFRGTEKMKNDESFDRGKYASTVLKYAKQLWNMRIDLTTDILCTHDTYLKLYQLSNPQLSGYKIIYLDESQDSNPCLLDIINKQKCKVVLVGDKHQSIYQFRGAVNAMDVIDCKTFELTKSFRFGQKLADVSSNLIFGYNGKISGNELKDTNIAFKTEDVSKLKEGDTYVRIYRTNTALIDEAINMIAAGLKVNMTIDISGFISLLKSGLALKEGKLRDVKHRDLLTFTSWGELKAVNALIKDPEFNRLIAIVEEDRVESVVKVLENYKQVADPDVIMSTAHGVKGLQYDYVFVADDFMIPEVEKGSDAKIRDVLPETELNLLYVAITRAVKGVRLNGLVNTIVYDSTR